MFAKWKKRRALGAAVKAVERWQHGTRPVLQVKAFRRYEQAHVVRDYYRPTGYVWKQSLPLDIRQKRAARVRALSTYGRDIHFLLAYYGLIYRLEALSDAESAAITNILLSAHLPLEPPENVGADKLVAGAFDLLLLQHAVQAWSSLSANAEFLLQTKWAPMGLKDLAGDMAVQGRYQQVMTKIFQNTVKPEDIIPVSKAATLADDAAGGESSGAGHYRGLISAMEGNLEAAIDFHANAGRGGYRTQFMRAGGNVVPLSSMRDLEIRPAQPPANFAWLKADSEQTECSLIACDEGYFYQFFDGFAESFALKNPGGLLHLHGVGFVPDSVHVATQALALGVDINISHDDMDMPALNPDIFKGFAAGARYLFLPQLLEKYERIIVHDIDGVLEKSMSDIWSSSDADIQISSLVLEAGRKGHFALWSNIGAGAFAVRRSEAALRFTKALSNYLADRFHVCLKTGGRYFFSDQVGLLLATLAYKEEVSLARMPQIFSQTDETRNTGRGKAKKVAQQAALEKQKAEALAKH